MLVQCVINDIRDQSLSERDRTALSAILGTETYLFPLSKGRVYLVYALAIEDGTVSYFILGEDSDNAYPIARMSVLFSVVDDSVSRYWTFASRTGPRTRQFFFGPRPWAIRGLFYERLVDGAEPEIREFGLWRERIDLEFPHPDYAFAQDLGANWVRCVRCDASWQSSATNGALRCPECRSLLRNPLWSPVT